MKEIVIVSKGNNAVAYGEGVEIKKSGSTGINANLAVLNELLKTVVPTEAGETHRIFLMDLIQGINSGYAIDYVKTGKQLNGEPLHADDLAGYKEFYELYKDRLLNLRFNQVSYIPKMRDNKVLMELRNKAYAILNSMPAVSTNSAPQTTILDPDKELRETMTELMTNALKSGDMETYKMLKSERDALRAPEVVTVSGSNSNQSNAPKFDVTDGAELDAINFHQPANSQAEKDNNDAPIEFNLEQDNKPTWDDTQA